VANRDPELEDLEHEFNTGPMPVDVYAARRKEILERIRARGPEAPKAPGPSRRVDFERLASVESYCDPEDLRVIEGIASSPRANAHGYAVDPLGASWDLPLPLCLEHDTKKRIGWVVAAKAMPTRIEFTANLARPGLYPDTEDVWSRIVRGDIAGVSAGHDGDIGSWKSYRVDVDRVAHRWNWTELTVTASPANPDAKILLVKSTRRGHDVVMRDARPARRVVRLFP